MSSILSTPDRIAPRKLMDQGFYRSGWGSPRTQKEKKTNMYEFYDIFNDMLVRWFPRNWEGYAYINGVPATEQLRKRCWVSLHATSGRGDDEYVSPVLKTMDELKMFIELVKNEQVKKFKSWENL